MQLSLRASCGSRSLQQERLGRAAGSVTRPARRAPWSARAAAAPVREAEEVEAQPASNKDALSAELAARMNGATASTSGRVVLDSADDLRSTLEHRLWVGSTLAALAATAALGAGKIEGLGGVAEAGAGVLAAYVISDLLSGVYHWIVDNYGDGSTPVLGSQIAAFQGHHQRPWTITEREFCNNVHLTCKPALPVALASAAAAAALSTPVWWDAFISTGTLMVVLAQQFHAWSHMKRSELPAAVVALQEAGLLISRKDHGAHHKAPYNVYYSIVSGWTNPLLDQLGFYTALEHAVKAVSGLEPRSWYDTPEDWLEMQRPGSSSSS